ncbi:hypothetical protein [Cypionkella sp.]|uniref:hypothetical protein n=1 Tax=Cypionkella sp. TaxID=2811411 RepID=UPI00263676D2|nr:hypothetical protein [Cypionkella sp.]
MTGNGAADMRALYRSGDTFRTDAGALGLKGLTGVCARPATLRQLKTGRCGP